MLAQEELGSRKRPPPVTVARRLVSPITLTLTLTLALALALTLTPTLTPTLTLPLNLTLTLTVARRFVSEVDALIVDLQRTHTSFIRCVKPNRLGLGLRLGLRLGSGP